MEEKHITGRQKIDRWIDRSTTQYKLDTPSKKLLETILEDTTREIIQNAEKHANQRQYKHIFLHTEIIRQSAQEILTTTNQNLVISNV